LPTYEKIGRFQEGLAPVKVKGKYKYINKQGGLAITQEFELANEFSESLAAVRVAQKWGYINHEGRMIISPQFDMVMPFKNGLARVWFNNHDSTGYINQNGKRVWQSKVR
jgi:hypothetical protein